MSPKTYTALFIVGMAVAGIAYDLIAYSLWGNDATISRLTLGTSDRFHLFVLLVGLVVGAFLGHVFLPQHVTTP